MSGHGGWVYQGRQEHGWFGNGTSPQANDTGGTSSGQSADGDLPPRIRSIAFGAIGRLPASQRARYERQLDGGALARLLKAMPAWNRATELDRETFRERYFGPLASDAVADHLRNAAQNIAVATTPEALRAGSADLAAAVQAVGLDRWPRFLAAADERAAAAERDGGEPGRQSSVVPAQELLLTPRPPFFFAEPPKGLIPRLMERIPRQSGKEAADNIPSWARGARRYVGETPREFAKRLMDEQYGPGKWDNTNPEFNKIKKFGERAFRNPRDTPPIELDDRPEAQLSADPNRG